MSSVQTPHFRTPFSLGTDGRVRVVEQDQAEEISQCVVASLSTRRGSLMDLPDFGIEDPRFEQLPVEPNVDTVLAVVEEDEPRAAFLSEVEVEDLVEQVTLKVGVRHG